MSAANNGTTDRATALEWNSGESHALAWQTYKRLLVNYVKPHWKIAALAVAAMVAMAATQAGFVALIKPLLDDGFVERDPATIRLMPVAIIVLFIAHGVAMFFSEYLMKWIARRMVKSLRTELHEKILGLPNGYFDQMSSGRLIAKMTYESEHVAGSVTEAALAIIRDGARVVFIFGYMIYLSLWLILMVLVIGPIIAGIIIVITKRFRKISRRIHRAVGGVANVAEETVEGFQVIKIFGQGEQERQRFERVNEQNRKQFMKFTATKLLAAPAVQLVAAIALAVMIYLATLGAVMETLTVGTFVSFVGAVMFLNPPLKSLTRVNAVIQKGITAAQSIYSVLDAPSEADHGTRTIQRADGRIEFDGVRFAYDPEKGDVLHDIRLTADPGEKVALVGRSGSGKTTLINLIPRFYEPLQGEIRLDGVPLGAYRLKDLRRQIALVGQQVCLFNTSLEENIAYGAVGSPTRDEIWAAAEAAYAVEFIRDLPRGMDTVVGENGTMLSGGQRQRVAIARALLKDAPILILDEATSALDTESEHYIQQALEQLMKGRTTFVIAHRLSTVEHADKIVVLHHGNVVEQGTHGELLAAEGRYAALYRTQFEDGDVSMIAAE